MSSNAYYAEVSPDPFLRRIVLAISVVLALSGIPLILILPVAPLLRVVAVLGWLASTVREISRLRRAWNASQGMRFFTDGTVFVHLPGQVWHPARLISGGFLLRKTAWIRLEVVLPDGSRAILGELLRGDCRESHDWRRLQVIWRHIGA